VALLTGYINEYNISKLALPNRLLEFVVIICSLAIMVRRIHDFGSSGWFILLIIIPFVGLIFALIPSDSNPNKYGTPPYVN
jgi:uncharacterized membrane protein YhaH (DUF805 family)